MMTAAPAKPRPGAAVASWRAEVWLKPGLSDPAGASVLAQLPAIGIQSAAQVRVGQLYRITGRLGAAQAASAARDLLADPVTQDYAVGPEGAEPARERPHWRIEVWLKPTVSDPPGESVRRALAELGLPEPQQVRCGAAYKISGRLGQAQAERIAVKLLANPVVHRFSVSQR